MLLGVTASAALRAVDIEGTIIIKRRLTKRRVTAPVSAYDRGVTVELGSTQQPDSLAFERSRVAVYLEGEFPTKPITVDLEQKIANLPRTRW